LLWVSGNCLQRLHILRSAVVHPEERSRLRYHVWSLSSNHGGHAGLFHVRRKPIHRKVYNLNIINGIQLNKSDDSLSSLIIHWCCDTQHNRGCCCDSGPIHAVVGKGQRPNWQIKHGAWVRAGWQPVGSKLVSYAVPWSAVEGWYSAQGSRRQPNKSQDHHEIWENDNIIRSKLIMIMSMACVWIPTTNSY
jgi:hypothetical protein